MADSIQPKCEAKGAASSKNIETNVRAMQMLNRLNFGSFISLFVKVTSE